ncbi:hypothetical protein K439DRAFT_1662305 [Ramaria rubella]|nr:hypothetical protein K439DRAFT_1662305 [Ramaria rubella]
MGEVVNVVVAFAVIVFIFRWATRGGGGNEETRRARNLLGFQPKHVTPEMISTVQSMFPHIPHDNIHFDLLRTGNVEVTSNKLLERGYLDAETCQPPPTYSQLYPVQAAPAPAAPSSASSPSTKPASQPTLISRFDLEERLRSEKETVSTTMVDAGGKATWEDTPERREASLRERKAQMVLAARKRLLEQRNQEKAASS